jgi:NAD(P)H dehydrogenase (quinone)
VPADRVFPTVTTRDIGLTAAKALLEGPPADKVDVLELAGLRDLSARDVAKMFADKLGHDVVVEEAPLAAVVPAFTSFGISENMAGLYREMYEGMTNGTIDWEGGKARHLRGATDPAAVIGGFLA